MKRDYQPEIIGSLIGFLVGLIACFIFPFLLLGPFGGWLDSTGISSSIYFAYLSFYLRYPVNVIIIFIILGALIGHLVKKYKS